MDKRFRILVVDDEKPVLRLYKSALTSIDRKNNNIPPKKDVGKESRKFPGISFELTFCDQAETAVKTVKKSLEINDPFAVVFMDLNMPPGKDGDWAAKKIRKMDKHIEIVIVTGFSNRSPVSLSAGIKPLHKLLYLDKPLHMWEIAQFAAALSEKWLNEKQVESLKNRLRKKVVHQNRKIALTNVELTREIDSRKEAQETLKNTLLNLRQAFGGIIQVITSMIEVRDPYTAGHQIRVADLARSIASEMGCSQKTIEGIRIAATVHDLGKICIPSDILNKPGSLSEVEMMLIKSHVQTGFDLLKDISFPWPVASIIYQHHEKLDGTGYPNGLSGEEIMLEARIIAVADVVEAMKSHRPYRSALGLDEALDEVLRLSGHSLDPEIVGICIKLFKDKNFKFRK